MAVQNVKIRLRNITKSFYAKGKNTPVLGDISLDVYENEFLVLLGPGQCGKTVILNIIAGLEEQSSGTIEFSGGRPKMGELGVVFQKYALFPWKTVMGNVEMGPQLKHVKKEVRREKAQSYIDLVGLTGFERALPKQLSGGMKQRVGIARAYSSESDIMLMDEPFGALDAQTRYSMEEEILKIWEKKKRTVIFVTNNLEEAIYLGDRIILLGDTPTVVRKEYVPDIPRPRNYTDPAFLALRNEIAENTDLVL
ncbi:MAG: ABC transporter ATP-binding protein [Eubacteriales bacterium]|nr:ABC transporter ATP-binding protein [Eubacteriales bacterium]